MLHLCCHTGFSLVVANWACLLGEVLGFPLRWVLLWSTQLWSAQPSGVVARGLSSCDSQALGHRLGSCGPQTQLLHSMWGIPGSGTKLVSPALASEFFTTEPPGKLTGKILNLTLFFCKMES